MIIVKKMPGDSEDSLIKKFSKQVTTHGIIPEIKKRQFRLKPSLAKKLKREEARRNRKLYG